MKGGGFFNMFKKAPESAANLEAKRRKYLDTTYNAAFWKNSQMRNQVRIAEYADDNTEYVKKQYEEQKKRCENQKRIYDECIVKLNQLYTQYKNTTLKVTDRLKAVASVGLKALTGTRYNIAKAKSNAASKQFEKADKLATIISKKAQEAADKEKKLEDTKVTLREATNEVAAARDATIDAQTAAAAAAAQAANKVVTAVAEAKPANNWMGRGGSRKILRKKSRASRRRKY
jgi:hypothetical protein